MYDATTRTAMMLVRRHVSLLRRALGEQRWIVESQLQRGYRIAPAAFAAEQSRVQRSAPPSLEARA